MGLSNSIGGSAPATDVLIATPFEPENVEIIHSAADGTNVHYRPDLIPTARYPGDHDGDASHLTSGQIAEWASLLARAEVLLGLDFATDGRLRTRAPKLRWVQGTSSGMSGYIKRAGLVDSDVVVTTAAGIHAGPLAEWVLMCALYFTKRIPTLRSWQAQHHWQRCAVGELAGRHAVLVGVGEVGRKVAATLAAAGVEVAARRRRHQMGSVDGVSRMLANEVQWHHALRAADFLVIAAPATAETEHLVGHRELALMKSDAVVINIGRGAVVDESALIKCLERGTIAGAALDVFEQEPLTPTSPLWDMDNVLISPHSASTVPAENRRIAELFATNLRRYRSREPLINQFDPSREY